MLGISTLSGVAPLQQGATPHPAVSTNLLGHFTSNIDWFNYGMIPATDHGAQCIVYYP